MNEDCNNNNVVPVLVHSQAPQIQDTKLSTCQQISCTVTFTTGEIDIELKPSLDWLGCGLCDGDVVTRLTKETNLCKPFGNQFWLVFMKFDSFTSILLGSQCLCHQTATNSEGYIIAVCTPVEASFPRWRSRQTSTGYFTNATRSVLVSLRWHS